MRRISIAAMRRNGIVSFSARDKSAIFGPIRSRRTVRSAEPSRAVPYLDGSVLRSFLQHDARLIDHVADRVSFDDFGSLDVIAFVEEKAAVNVHGSRPPGLGGALACRLTPRRLCRHSSPPSSHPPPTLSR